MRKELFFFDHVHVEAPRAGDVIESSSPIGHDPVDIARQIEMASGVDVPALRWTVLRLHDDEPNVPFRMGDVSITNVRFVSRR